MPLYKDEKFFPYSPENIFNIVSDIKHYPDFLPWCSQSHIYPNGEDKLIADLTVGKGFFSETYRSYVELKRPYEIRAHSAQKPFKYMQNEWLFSPYKNGCKVSFKVDFELKSRLLSHALELFFDEAIEIMIKAFSKRVEDIYKK